MRMWIHHNLATLIVVVAGSATTIILAIFRGLS